MAGERIDLGYSAIGLVVKLETAVLCCGEIPLYGVGIVDDLDLIIYRKTKLCQKVERVAVVGKYRPAFDLS